MICENLEIKPSKYKIHEFVMYCGVKSFPVGYDKKIIEKLKKLRAIRLSTLNWCVTNAEKLNPEMVTLEEPMPIKEVLECIEKNLPIRMGKCIAPMQEFEIFNLLLKENGTKIYQYTDFCSESISKPPRCSFQHYIKLNIQDVIKRFRKNYKKYKTPSDQTYEKIRDIVILPLNCYSMKIEEPVYKQDQFDSDNFYLKEFGFFVIDQKIVDRAKVVKVFLDIRTDHIRFCLKEDTEKPASDSYEYLMEQRMRLYEKERMKRARKQLRREERYL